MSEENILFTGFPGFIGQKLASEIFEKSPECRLIFLVLDSFVEQARREAAKKLPGRNFEIIAGDIAQDKLGVGNDRYEKLTTEITDVFHLAAIYDLATPEQIAHQVNVTGTQNIVRFCNQAIGLKSLVYFSTCYVAGCCTGTVCEDDLPSGQKFKNHYESTKHEAERIVRQHMGTIPTIIIRPSIVVGDSRTGEAQKFDGPFFGMIMTDRLKRFMLPLPYIGPLRSEVNIVPVDFVVSATAALWKMPKSLGKCYALADPTPPSTREVYEMIIKGLGAKGPWGKIPPWLIKTFLGFKMGRKFLGVPREVVEYYNHGVHYDTTNATRELSNVGIECPRFVDYFAKMIEFYKNNKHRKELYVKVL